MSKKSIKRTFVAVNLLEADGEGLYYEVPAFAGKVKEGDLVVVPVHPGRSIHSQRLALGVVVEAWKAYEAPRRDVKFLAERIRVGRFKKEVKRLRERRSLERILAEETSKAEAFAHIRAVAENDEKLSPYLKAYDKIS